MKVTLARQVTGSDQRVLPPGEHDLPETEAEHYRKMGWLADEAPVDNSPPKRVRRSRIAARTRKAK